MNAQVLLISQYFKKMYESYSKDILERYVLSQIEMDILAFLYNNSDMDTAKDIVDVRMISKSNVSSAIESLILKEYVIRHVDDVDKRKIRLQLLPKSVEITEDIVAMQQSFTDELFRGFSKSEKKEFGKLIRRLLKNVLNSLGKEKQ